MAKRSLGYPGGPDDGVTRVLITRRHRGICPQTRRRRREERRFENEGVCVCVCVCVCVLIRLFVSDSS